MPAWAGVHPLARLSFQGFRRAFRHYRHDEFLDDSHLLVRLLKPRIGFGDNDADGVLVETFEAAFALQILPNDTIDLRHKTLL
jgi:hypothetical protein